MDVLHFLQIKFSGGMNHEYCIFTGYFCVRGAVGGRRPTAKCRCSVFTGAEIYLQRDADCHDEGFCSTQAFGFPWLHGDGAVSTAAEQSLVTGKPSAGISGPKTT